MDEFQHFATPDFNELFSEGRKFKVRLTIAHQFRGQLPTFLQDSTMTARTTVCFQTTPEDGREMAHLFPAPAEGVRPEDVSPHPTGELLARSSDYPPAIQAFVKWYLQPLQAHKRGHRIEIRYTGVSLFDMLNGGRSENPRWPDPTPYLDSLLYQVMCNGESDVPIPSDAVRGFANCGKGFFKEARGLTDGNWLLSPQVRFPPALVVPAGDGTRWTRKPEDGTEQLFHFIYCLRKTMLHLAENPIGKPSQPSTADVGKMLTSLPRRAAFVRSGNDVGVLYTHHTPQRVKNTDLRKRAAAIVLRTRQKYCHPREEVEAALAQPVAANNQGKQHGSNGFIANDAAHNQQPPASRWEEVE